MNRTIGSMSSHSGGPRRLTMRQQQSDKSTVQVAEKKSRNPYTMVNPGSIHGPMAGMINDRHRDAFPQASERPFERPPPGALGGRPPPGALGGRPPTEALGGRPPPGALGGRPPPGALGGRPPPEALGGRPPPEALGGRPPPGALGGRPPPEALGGRPPQGALGGRPPPVALGPGSADRFGRVNKGGKPDACFYQPPPMAANINATASDPMAMRRGLAPERSPLVKIEDKSKSHIGQMNRGGMTGKSSSQLPPMATSLNTKTKDKSATKDELPMMRGLASERVLDRKESTPKSQFKEVKGEGMSGKCFYQPPPMAASTITSDGLAMSRVPASEKVVGSMEGTSKSPFGEVKGEGMTGKCFYQPPPMADMYSASGNPEAYPTASTPPMEDMYSAWGNPEAYPTASTPPMEDMYSAWGNPEAYPTASTPPMEDMYSAWGNPEAYPTASTPPMADMSSAGRDPMAIHTASREDAHDYGLYEKSIQMRENTTALNDPMIINKAPRGSTNDKSACPGKKVKKKKKKDKPPRDAGREVSSQNSSTKNIVKPKKERICERSFYDVFLREPECDSKIDKTSLAKDALAIQKGFASMERAPLVSREVPLQNISTKNIVKPKKESVCDRSFYDVFLREPECDSKIDKTSLAKDALAIQKGFASMKRAPLVSREVPLQNIATKNIVKPKAESICDRSFYDVFLREPEFDSKIDQKSLSKDALAIQKGFASMKRAPFVSSYKNLITEEHTTNANDTEKNIYEENQRQTPGSPIHDASTPIERTSTTDLDRIKACIEEDLAQIKNLAEADYKNIAARFEIELDTLSNEASDTPMDIGDCKDNLFDMSAKIYTAVDDSLSLEPARKELELSKQMDINGAAMKDDTKEVKTWSACALKTKSCSNSDLRRSTSDGITTVKTELRQTPANGNVLATNGKESAQNDAMTQEDTPRVITEMIRYHLNKSPDAVSEQADHLATGDASLQSKFDTDEDAAKCQKSSHIKDETYAPIIGQGSQEIDSHTDVSPEAPFKADTHYADFDESKLISVPRTSNKFEDTGCRAETNVINRVDSKRSAFTQQHDQEQDTHIGDGTEHVHAIQNEKFKYKPSNKSGPDTMSIQSNKVADKTGHMDNAAAQAMTTHVTEVMEEHREEGRTCVQSSPTSELAQSKSFHKPRVTMNLGYESEKDVAAQLGQPTTLETMSIQSNAIGDKTGQIDNAAEKDILQAGQAMTNHAPEVMEEHHEESRKCIQSSSTSELAQSKSFHKPRVTMNLGYESEKDVAAQLGQPTTLETMSIQSNAIGDKTGQIDNAAEKDSLQAGQAMTNHVPEVMEEHHEEGRKCVQSSPTSKLAQSKFYHKPRAQMNVGYESEKDVAAQLGQPTTLETMSIQSNAIGDKTGHVNNAAERVIMKAAQAMTNHVPEVMKEHEEGRRCVQSSRTSKLALSKSFHKPRANMNMEYESEKDVAAQLGQPTTLETMSIQSNAIGNKTGHINNAAEKEILQAAQAMTNHVPAVMEEHHEEGRKCVQSSPPSELAQSKSFHKPRAKMNMRYELEKDVAAQLGQTTLNYNGMDESGKECRRQIHSNETTTKTSENIIDVSNNVEYGETRKRAMEAQTGISQEDSNEKVEFENTHKVFMSTKNWNENKDTRENYTQKREKVEYENTLQELISTMASKTFKEVLNERREKRKKYTEKNEDTLKVLVSTMKTQTDILQQNLNEKRDACNNHTQKSEKVEYENTLKVVMSTMTTQTDMLKKVLNELRDANELRDVSKKHMEKNEKASQIRILDSKPEQVNNVFENIIGTFSGDKNVLTTDENSVDSISEVESSFTSPHSYQITDKSTTSHIRLDRKPEQVNNAFENIIGTFSGDKNVLTTDENSVDSIRKVESSFTNPHSYQITDKSTNLINKVESKRKHIRKTTKTAGITLGTQTIYSMAKDVLNRNTYSSKPRSVNNNVSSTRDDIDSHRYYLQDKSKSFTNKVENKQKLQKKTITNVGISPRTQNLRSSQCGLVPFINSESSDNDTDAPTYAESEYSENASDIQNHAEFIEQHHTKNEKGECRVCSVFVASVDACDARWNRHTERPWHVAQQEGVPWNQYCILDEDCPGEHIFRNLKLDLPVGTNQQYRLGETLAQLNDDLDKKLLEMEQPDRSDKYRVGTPQIPDYRVGTRQIPDYRDGAPQIPDDDDEDTGCCGCCPRKKSRSTNKNNSNSNGRRGNMVMRFLRGLKARFTR